MSNTPSQEAQELTAMLKRRGFIQPAYELYGGTAGFYDYGPLGQALKRRFEDLWREHYVIQEGFGEVSTPTIAPEPVFQASGHLDQFDDVLVECPGCRTGTRADHMLEDEFQRLAHELENNIQTLTEDAETDEDVQALIWARERIMQTLDEGRATVETEADEDTIRELLAIPTQNQQAPITGVEETHSHLDLTLLPCAYQITDTRHDDIILAGEITCQQCGHGLPREATVAPFNLMFATRIGPGDSDPGYLRPETAQGLFVNMPWLYRYHREKIPFGAVQIGRAYRNEISPRQGLIRLREFWQAEAEVFVDPNDKTHPRFDAIKTTNVPLVPADNDPLETTLETAVEKGIIKNQQVAYYIARTQQILTQAGIHPDRLRFRQHESDEMAHYASDCWDAEFQSQRYGWVECVGIADRGCYDLEKHQKESNDSMEAFRRYDEPQTQRVTRIEPDMGTLGPTFKKDAGTIAEKLKNLDPETIPNDEPLTLTLNNETIEIPPDAYEIIDEEQTVHGETFLPHVIEPSYGIDRILYAILEHAWKPSEDRNRLQLPPRMAPIQVGILPLVSKDGLPKKAQTIETTLKQHGIHTRYDDGGSIGRRYARLDEIGTPLAITIDHQTLEDDTVTVRDRDTQNQTRTPTNDLPTKLLPILNGQATFNDL